MASCLTWRGSALDPARALERRAHPRTLFRVRGLEFRHFARRRRERKVAPGGAERHPGFISRAAFAPGRGARNPCTPAGVQHSRYGNPGLRSLRSLNPGLNSQHASGVLRLTFQRRHRLADEPENRRRNLVFPLPLRHFARRRRERKVALGGAERHPGCNIPVTVTPGCARFARLTRG